MLVAGLWALGTATALAVTLPSVQPGKDFDGLNNMFQISFALPWSLLPVGSRDHVRDTWVAAGMGLLNAGLIYRWMAVRKARACVCATARRW